MDSFSSVGRKYLPPVKTPITQKAGACQTWTIHHILEVSKGFPKHPKVFMARPRLGFKSQKTKNSPGNCSKFWPFLAIFTKRQSSSKSIYSHRSLWSEILRPGIKSALFQLHKMRVLKKNYQMWLFVAHFLAKIWPKKPL